ncbi:uncharacterized protein LOC121878667 [Homarus americanus]|uniref:uncharacterized protein LOC121878667 n=1 Tax=Homarus americanus TaxID=6706 RepID=UPI001C43792A|nr:uncharacterized protein LOC121878667 [Homarus americanus]
MVYHLFLQEIRCSTTIVLSLQELRDSSEQIEAAEPGVFPACAVTRAVRKKAECVCHEDPKPVTDMAAPVSQEQSKNLQAGGIKKFDIEYARGPDRYSTIDPCLAAERPPLHLHYSISRLDVPDLESWIMDTLDGPQLGLMVRLSGALYPCCSDVKRSCNEAVHQGRALQDGQGCGGRWSRLWLCYSGLECNVSL